jgi:hypothetical protein
MKDSIVSHEKELEKNDIIYHKCFAHAARTIAYIMEINYSYTEGIFNKQVATKLIVTRYEHAMEHQAKLIDLLQMNEPFPWEDMKFKLTSGFNGNDMYTTAQRHYNFDSRTFCDLARGRKFPEKCPWSLYDIISKPVITFLDDDKLEILVTEFPRIFRDKEKEETK